MEKPPGLDKAIESEPYKKYGLKYVGIGADKICFEVEGSERKLIKVATDTLREKIIQSLTGEVGSIAVVSQFERKLMEEYKKDETVIEDVFGKEHVLKKGFFRFSIPVTREVATVALGDEYSELINKIDENNVPKVAMIVETQPIAEELKHPEERYTIDLRIPLLKQDEFMKSRDVDEALEKVRVIVVNRIDGQLADLANKKQYIEMEKVIIQKIIEYTKRTGQMLDMFGQKNITIFLNKENDLDYHLLDVVLPGLKKDREKNIKEDRKLGLLRPYYTYYYAVNYLAEKLGLDENLETDDLLYFEGASIPTGNFPK